MRRLKHSVVILVMLLLCSFSSAGAEQKEFTATINKDGIQRVSVLGGSYFLAPNYIIVKVNVPVELKIRKEGIIPLDFVLHAPEAGMDVKSSLEMEPTVVRFTPTRIGKYSFWHFVHYGTRAVSGAGLLIQEATAIAPEGRISLGDLGIWSDKHAEAFKLITAFVRAQGTVPGVQLAHAGRKADLTLQIDKQAHGYNMSAINK